MRILDVPDLRDRGIKYSRPHLQRLEDAHKFPRRMKIGSGKFGRIGWVEDEIDAWLEAKAATRERPEEATAPTTLPAKASAHGMASRTDLPDE